MDVDVYGVSDLSASASVVYPNIAWHDCGSFIVLAGISYDLHMFVNGTINADEILRSHFIPYAGAIGQDFVLMDDNAITHRARIVNRDLDDQGVERMEWSY